MEVRAKYKFGSITASIRLAQIVGVTPIRYKLTILNGSDILVKEFSSIKQAIGASLSLGCLSDKWVIETI